MPVATIDNRAASPKELLTKATSSDARPPRIGTSSEVAPSSSDWVLDPTQGALEKLYATLIALQRASSQSAHAAANANQHSRAEAQARAQRLTDEAEKQRNEGGAFAWLSRDMGVAGLIGACTLNFGLVAVDLAVHKTGLLRRTDIDVIDITAAGLGGPAMLFGEMLLRKSDWSPLKPAVENTGSAHAPVIVSDDDVRSLNEKALAVGLAVAGTAAGVFTAGTTTAVVFAIVGVALSAGAEVSEALDGPKELTLGLRIGSTATALCSGFAGGPGALTDAQLAARAIGATSSAASGANTAVVAVHEHAADQTLIDRQEVSRSARKLEAILDAIIEGLSSHQESLERSTKLVFNQLHTHHETTLYAASAYRG